MIWSTNFILKAIPIVRIGASATQHNTTQHKTESESETVVYSVYLSPNQIAVESPVPEPLPESPRFVGVSLVFT